MEKTDVIFRKFSDGEVIALFPGIAGAMGKPWTCSSYMRIGQHAAASVGVVDSTRPASVKEYAALRRELQAAPYKYKLKVVKRFTPKHRADRESQLA